MAQETLETPEYLLCSDCFKDEGLRIDVFKHGIELSEVCPQCGGFNGKKLTKDHIEALAWRFFVRGTTIRCEYGGAPVIQFNSYHYGESDLSPSAWIGNDIKLIEEAVQIGFFHYGPRLWMLGEIEPLLELRDPVTRPKVISRVLNEFPEHVLPKGSRFYRLRICPAHPADPLEYDSPPMALERNGRLDSDLLTVMYGSQDLDICIHECRASSDDDIFVATLETQKDLRLLDLTHVIDEDVSEFESLDMAIHMLFLARSHSYEISREIAKAAKASGFDGIIYPSYFSLIRTGGQPFETAYGLAMRRIHPDRENYAENFTIQNFALFGRPLEQGIVSVECINRLILTQVGYQGHFGPVEY